MKTKPVWARISIGALAGFAALALAATADAETPKDIYRQAGPGVVLILASDDGRAGSGGTGSIVRGDGLVITNAHVVINKETNRPYRRLSLFLKPERVTGNMDKDLLFRIEAKLAAYDESLDLALLRMEKPPAGLTIVPLGDPEEISIGEPVIAIGHPETGGLWTLTTGTISAEFENFNGIKGKDVFQTEASLNRGNSGGPLLDSRGEMVGVNTSISRKAADGLTITSINFAVKSSVARKWLVLQNVELPFAASGGAPGGAVVSPDTSDRLKQVSPLPPAAGSSESSPSKPPAPLEKPSRKSSNHTAESGPSKTPDPPTQTLTEARPYDLDQLVADQMKEMEDMMEEIRKKFR
ncbi:MAG TPA: serine protease [Nitrospiria bacterium]